MAHHFKIQNFPFIKATILLSLILLYLGLFISKSYASQFSGCTNLPPASGDWIINSTDDCWILSPVVINGSIIVNGKLTIDKNVQVYVPAGKNLFVNPGAILNNSGTIIATTNISCSNECDYGSSSCVSLNLVECWSYGDSDPCSEWVPIGSVECCTDADCSGTLYCDTATGDIYQSGSCVSNTCTGTLYQDCVDTCTDSDNGQNYQTQGTVTDKDLCSAGDTSCPSNTYTDYCSGPSIVEYYCSGTNVASTTYNCNNLNTLSVDTATDTCSWTDHTCSNGACVQEGSGNYDCDDYDSVNGNSLVDYEVDSTSCFVGCLGSNCCYLAANLTCDSTMNCQNYTFDEGITYYCTYDGTSWAWRTSYPAEVCNDGVDNDCDGYIDSNDPDCVETICDDGVDNDGDNLIDCADPDCAGQTDANGNICCQVDTDCPADYCTSTTPSKLVDWYCDTNTNTCASVTVCSFLCDPNIGCETDNDCPLTQVCDTRTCTCVDRVGVV